MRTPSALRHQPLRRYPKWLTWVFCFTLTVGMSGSSNMEGISRAETLEDAWNIAFAQSRKLQSQESQVEAAQAKSSAARASRLPKINNTSAYVALSERPMFQTDLNLGSALPPAMAGLFPSSIETPLADKNFALSLTTVTVPLYTGGKISGLIDAADALTTAAQSEHQGGIHDLKLEVAETYLVVLRTQRLVEVAQQAERSLAAHVKDVDNLLAAGLVTRSASLAADVAHADSEQKVLQAQVGFQTASAAYNRLLWRPLDAEVHLEEMDIPPFTGDLAALTAQAIANRSELNQLAAQGRALQAQAQVHRADRLPDVIAAAGYNYFENDAITPDGIFGGGVVASWTPFDGGVSRAQQTSAEHNAVAVARMREEAKTSIELQVRKCWLEEQETRKRVQVAIAAVQQADENVRVVTQQFREGLANHTEALDAETLRTQAWTNLCHATYDAIAATCRLRRAVGIL